MVLALAGKSDAIIACLRFSLSIFNLDEILAIPAESDPDNDTWQYSFKEYASSKGICVVKLEDVYDLEDLVVISIQYDKIINPSKFKSQRLYNIHFSYLPFYKGMYPIIWPILNGEHYSGVTLHELDWGIDTGNIIDQEKINFTPEITSRQLYNFCIEAAVQVYKKNIFQLLNNSYSSKLQPSNSGSYYSRESINFKNFEIKFRKTATEVSAQIRAMIFPEYQFPIFNNSKIVSVDILPERSKGKPGQVIELSKSFYIVSTVDFNVKLKISFYDELYSAIEIGDDDAVNEILEYIHNLEFTNNKGWTPLMVAVYNQRLEIAKLLIDGGANVNAQNFKGTSVLMYAKTAALRSNNIALLDYLIENGAQIDHKDLEGMSVLDYAKKEGNELIVDFLNSKSI